MDLAGFLSAVVPAGVLVIARKQERTAADGSTYSSFAHSTARLHSDAVGRILNLAQANTDVYFALAAYAQGFHQNPQDPARKQLRVRTNVAALKALWLDIDFKGAYPTPADAIKALGGFCKATALQAPSILVHSGNGLHVYWPLAQPETLERWQVLANALRGAAQAHGLAADLGCTVDACRVLRPPGTTNWKDPANPKPVVLLHGDDRTISYDQALAALTPWAASTPVQGGGAGTYDEFGGGLTQHTPGRYDEIIRHCGVLRHITETHGKGSSEPEWVGVLQVLKHCADGELWVHAVSDGHPGYSADATVLKWEQRKANTAGPTLCSTFAGYHPKLCDACPHNGFVKSPVQLGDAIGETLLTDLPKGWRVRANGLGVERLMQDPSTQQREWVRVLRHVPGNLRVTRSIVTGKYDLQFDVHLKGAKTWSVTLPSGTLGNIRKLAESMAEFGVVFKASEVKDFVDLMSTWLQKLQQARRVADVTEHLGWLTDGEIVVGFSAGSTTFYTDGRVRNDVKASREFSAVAKFYEPKGGLEPWKRVAKFLAEQNNPAFVTILAAAFGAPLLRFTGIPGGILSLVSEESGVGKSSALKCSQAVWGSPMHGINAVDDTPKSVARKLGFLNHMPAYWDEIRGKKTIEEFLTLAFQVTQGKERTRLDSSANLRDIQTWETMLIVAGNESIFDAMSRGIGGSDAGMVRTYEVVVDPFASTRNRAEIALMFEQLNANYGHAGRVYAQHLATNAKQVEERIRAMFTGLAGIAVMQAQERFWFAIMSALLVGAEIAAALDLVHIDRKALAAFLIDNLHKLRERTNTAVGVNQPSEIIAAFMATHQDKALTVAEFPQPRQRLGTYIPDLIGGAPKSDKIVYHVSQNERLIRIPMRDLEWWLLQRNLPPYSTIKKLKSEHGAVQVRVRLGAGTRWELPPQRCLQLSLDDIARDRQLPDELTGDDSSSPDDTSDSSSGPRPAD